MAPRVTPRRGPGGVIVGPKDEDDADEESAAQARARAAAAAAATAAGEAAQRADKKGRCARSGGNGQEVIRPTGWSGDPASIVGGVSPVESSRLDVDDRLHADARLQVTTDVLMKQ